MAINKAQFLGGGKISASSTVGDYSNLSGYDLLTNPYAIADVRNYYRANGQEFGSTSEMWDQFYEDRRWSDVNTFSMGKDLIETATAGDDGREMLGRLSKLWANLPSRGSTMEKVIDYGAAGVLDPTNLIGFGSGAVATKAAQGARVAGKTLEQSAKAGITAGVKDVAKKEAALGLGIGAGFDAAQQANEIAQGVSDEFDVGRTIGAGLMDAAVSGGAAALLTKGAAELGVGEVAKGAGSLGDWSGSALGARLTQELSAINREKGNIATALSKTDDAAEKKIANDTLAQLNNDEARVNAIDAYVNNLDMRLDEIANEYQAALAEGREAGNIKQEFDDMLERRTNVLNMTPEQIFEAGFVDEPTITRAAPAEAPKQEAPEAAPKANEPKEETASADDAKDNTPAEGGDTDGEASVQPKGDAEGDVEEAPKVDVPEDWEFNSPNQEGKLGKLLGVKGDDLRTVVSDKIASGEFVLTKGNKLAKNTVRDFEQNKGIETDAASEEVSDAVAGVETATPRAPEETEFEPDVAEADESTPANQEAFDEALRKYQEIMDMLQGQPEWIERTRKLIDEFLKQGKLDATTFRYVNQLFDIHLDAETKGRVPEDAEAVAAMRKDYLRREGTTTPDTKEGTTANRSAASTQKSMDAMETGPKTAGKSIIESTDPRTGEKIVRTKPQDIVRKGYDIGDGYSVLNAADRFSAPDLNLAVLREMARAEGENGKTVYEFVAAGGEKIVGRPRIANKMAKATKGERLFYAPATGKVYPSEDIALKALGLKANKSAPSAKKVEVEEPLTAEEAKKARDDAFTEFEKSGDIEGLKEANEKVDRQTGTPKKKKKKAAVNRDDIPDGLVKEKDGMVFAMIPRVEGVGYTRVITGGQDGPAQVIGGANLNDYYLGYVPEGSTGKQGRDLLRSFEPYDADAYPELNGDRVFNERTFPIEAVEWATMEIEASQLTREQSDGLYAAGKFAKSSMVAIHDTADDFYKNGNIQFATLDLITGKMETAPWETRKGYGDKPMDPLSNTARMVLLQNLYTIRDKYAPMGVRPNTTTLNNSLDQLTKIMDGASSGTLLNLEKMIRSVVPSDRAPIFKLGNSPLFNRAHGPMAVKGAPSEINTIELAKNQNVDNTFPLTSEFIIAHELGHWVFTNVLDDASKREFFMALNKYYKANGRLMEDAQVEIMSKSPYVRYESKDGVQEMGAANWFDSPDEYFANQFAFFLTKHNDLMSVKDPSLFGKVARIVEALFRKIMGTPDMNVIDEDLVPIFNKLIVDDMEALRMKAVDPVEPKTNKGKAIQQRFVFMQEAHDAARSAYANGDIEQAAVYLQDLAEQLRGMSTSQKDASIAAVRKGEPYRSSYTGAFAVVGRHHTKMKKVARIITSATQRFTMEFANSDVASATSFGPEVEERIAAIFGEDLDQFIADIKFTMNNAFLDVEGGDIPQYAVPDVQIRKRMEPDGAGRTGMDKIRAAQRFKKVKGRQNAKNRKRKQAVKDIVKNKNAKDTDAPQSSKKLPRAKVAEMDLPTATEFYTRTLEDGKETAQSKQARRHIIELIRSKPNAKPSGNKDLLDWVKGQRQPDLVRLYSEALPDKEAADLARTIEYEFQRRGENQEISNNLVQAAIQTERMMEGVPGDDVTVPSKLPYLFRQAVSAITHRNSDMQAVARRVATRVAYLGNRFSLNTKSNEYKDFRNRVRKVASQLTKRANISEAMREVAGMVYDSEVIPTNQKENFQRAAGIAGYDPKEVLVALTMDVIDTKSTRTASDAFASLDDDFVKANMLESVNDARMSMREGVAYVTNGLIDSKDARQRFAPVMTYGNLKSRNADMDGASPTSRFIDRMPAEFAEDFANDYLSGVESNTLETMRNFTGGDLKVYYTSTKSGPMGDGTYVYDRPVGTLKQVGEDIKANLDEDQAYLVDELRETRGRINMLRAKGNPKAAQDLYDYEEALRMQLADLGVPEQSMVRPVLIRDMRPANINTDMLISDAVVKNIKRAIEAQEIEGMPSRSDAVFAQNRRKHKPLEMFEVLEQAAGSREKLMQAVRNAGYSSLNVNGHKMMLNDASVRDLRADTFDEPDMMVGENFPADAIPHVVNSMITENDAGDQAFDEVISAFETAGMPSKVTNVLSKIKKGKNITPKEGRELRKVAKWGLSRTNAQRLVKAGMKSLGNFFEPSDGGAGHFERYAVRTGAFIGPLQRMIQKMPQSDGGIKRYFRNGLGEMLYAHNTGLGESIAGLLRIPAPLRKAPVMEHLEILNALRNEDKVQLLNSQQREIYDHIRKYFNAARDRLIAAGYDVGNIARNYVPQIWRSDLIETDRENFVSLLAEYFTAEHASRGASLPAEDAIRKAEGVANKLIHEEGTYVGDPSAFAISKERNTDHIDFARMIRLDADFAKQFTDPRNPSRNLTKYLENDLMVIAAKYSDSVEQRIDIAEQFGVGGFGYYDYIAIMSGGVDAVSKLLRSNKVLRRDYKFHYDPSNTEDELSIDAAAAEFKRAVFHAPIQRGGSVGKKIADDKAKELAKMAHDGATEDDIIDAIMAMMPEGNQTPNSQKMRENFRFRAAAIARAIVDTDGLAFLPEPHMVDQADMLYRATVRKPVHNPGGFNESLTGVSSALRTFNSVTLLPFTTLASLGDFMLPVIKSGSLRSSVDTWKKFAADTEAGAEYREMIRNIGASTQNIVQERMSRAFGMDSTRFSAGFFTTIGLTDWTNVMRDISAASGYEWFKASQELAIRKPNTKAGRTARRVLDEYGLTDFYKDPTLNIEMVMKTGGSANLHPRYFEVAGALHKFTNQTIFTPNPNDLPLWAQTPIGQVVFQLKSFPLMMSRLGYEVYREAGHGNFMPLFYFAGAPVLGAGITATRDVVQGRGGEDNREFAVRERSMEFLKDYGLTDNEDIALYAGWYRDGLLQMGGLGLIGSMLYDSVEQLDNGAYGQNRTLSLLLGPSLGVVTDAHTVLAGGVSAVDNAIMGEGPNGKARAAVRTVIKRLPGGQVAAPREYLVDSIAGEQGD